MSLIQLRPPGFVGYVACAWALIFAGVHLYWASGGTVGLQGHLMTGLLFWINLVAIPLCLLAAIVAIALVKSWDKMVSRRMWLIAAWGACILLGLRGGVGIMQSVFSQDSIPILLIVYDTWFLLGGVLFGITARFNRSKNGIVFRLVKPLQ